MRNALLIVATFITSVVFSQRVTISGLAPAYVGKTIEVFEIQDYITHREQLITSTTVEKDSSFSLSILSEDIQKIILKSDNNKGFLYVEPGTKYHIFFPALDKYAPYRPNGNSVEIGFISLDSTDINYKILSFQRWMDDFIGNNYHLRSRDQVQFGKNLDRFKENVYNAYESDSSLNSDFLKTYIRFSIAGLDNIRHAAERNRYEKHDFYLKYSPVAYKNDAYMAYLKDFYQEMIPRLSDKANTAVYTGVLKSSPSMIMRALGSEYTLINMRIRELVMIQSLAEVYHSGEFPQTNIITVLDSVAKNSLFEANGQIAENLMYRLTELSPGSKAPDFVLTQQGKKTKTLFEFRDKYVYMHFVDPDSEEGMKEVPLLKDLHAKYGEYIRFITIYREKEDLSDESIEVLESVPWDVYRLPAGNSLWKQYRVESFPGYVLIDVTGNIVASPALGPRPNGQYETIDKTFYYIRQQLTESETAKDPYDRNH